MANPRLLNFISEQEVEEIRKKRGERGDNEPTVPDRPLFEVLKENKEKQQAEFNERFKHQPPKALDEDETDFLERVAKHQRELELQVANEEAEQLLSYQLAVAKRTFTNKEPSSSFHQAKEVPVPQKEKRAAAPVKSILSTIKIKPLPKKAKVEDTVKEKRPPIFISAPTKASSTQAEDLEVTEPKQKKVMTGLVAYGTDSSEEEEEDV